MMTPTIGTMAKGIKAILGFKIRDMITAPMPNTGAFTNILMLPWAKFLYLVYVIGQSCN